MKSTSWTKAATGAFAPAPSSPSFPAWASRTLSKSVPWILPLLVVAGWQAAVSLRWAPPILLPSPEKVCHAFIEMLQSGLLLKDFLASIAIVARGFLFGALAGLALGAYVGLSRRVEAFFGPFLDAFRQIPPLAVLPLVVLWAGVGDTAKVLVISKAVFFPIFLNTVQGIRGVGRDYVEVGKVLRLTRWQFVRKIIIPGALPSILVGVRFGAGLSWAMIVAAEMLSGRTGLGFLIQHSQEMLFTDQMFVAIIVIAVFGFILDRSLRALERHLLRWKQGYAG